MYLADLKEDELECIANDVFSLDGDEDPIHTIFFDFRIKLLCQGLLFKNENNSTGPVSCMTSSFIKQVIFQFNHFYNNNTDDDFLRLKNFHQANNRDDFDQAPDIDFIYPFIKTIKGHYEKALALYALGLIFIWSEKNLWSFMATTEAEGQQVWFAQFYMASNRYFSVWEPLVTNIAVSSKISEQNSKAAKAKHKNSEVTKQYAIQCYVESRYKTVKQAALNISPSVIEYGKNVGFVFSSDYQAIDTIYKWLLSHKKRDK